METEATRRAAIERVVIDAFTRAFNLAQAPTRDTALTDIADSLGLVLALADIQSELAMTLQPEQTIEIFRSNSIADVAQVFGDALAAPIT